MPKLPELKARQVEKILLRGGFEFIRQKGSHRIYIKGKQAVTVPWHNKSLRKGTLRSIVRQSGMTVAEFLKQ